MHLTDCCEFQDEIFTGIYALKLFWKVLVYIKHHMLR